MDQTSDRYWSIMLEVFEHLPRQGPGNLACAARALRLCRHLPPEPAILDLGCGTGGQTLHLAELTSGPIVAVDSHAPSIERLTAAVAQLGLSQRITALVDDMSGPKHLHGAYDLIWSEGALYTIGLTTALSLSHDLLRPGGYLVFTDAVWLRADPPPMVKAAFDADYPEMGWLADDLAAIRASGLQLIGHFTLPDEAWWDDFYTPMESRIRQLRSEYTHDPEALDILEQLAMEPEMYRRHSEFYAYEFFVAQRPAAHTTANG